ncbi:hypothetical protein TWF281_011202 [Arthrobotrys megalospora]
MRPDPSLIAQTVRTITADLSQIRFKRIDDEIKHLDKKYLARVLQRLVTMTRTSFFVQTVISVLSLNGVVYAMDSEADWAFAANNLAKRAVGDVVIPSPTQKGQPENCILWKYVEKTDDCEKIIDKYKGKKLTEEKFLEFNPALSGDCENLKKNFYVCVQTSAAAVKTTTKTTTTTTQKGAGPTKAPPKEEEEDEEDEDEDEGGHPENPAPTKFTTKNPTAPTKLEAEEKDKFIITGAGDTTMEPRFCAERQNIILLQKNSPDTWNLLVLALDKMMKTADTDALSYFQMSGIHGAPYIPWPNPKEKGEFQRQFGYCTHNSIIFATWHRPYMLAFEQTLYRHARDIVRRLFKGQVQQKYIKALQTLRWPYWDWADSTYQSYLPPVTMEKQITVKAPNDQGGEKTVKIANPFYSYVFKGPEGTVFTGQFAGLKATSRKPETSDSSESLDADANRAMQSGFLTRRKQTYNALMSTSGFNFFSNSLEKLHNDVHMQVGGNGIMGLISYAAFDPMFWLHHNNIDRMLAIWQAANPGKYLSPDTGVPTFQRKVKSGEKDDLNTPLYPWKHPDGSWWKSDDVKDVSGIWSYGYGYPEVPCYYQGDTNTLDDFATKQINDRYLAPVSAMSRMSRFRRRGHAIATTGKNVTEWDVNVIVDQAELPGTFSIYVFLGQPPSDIKKWDESPQKVSTMTLLGTPGETKANKLEGMTIPLSPLLTEKGIKGSDKEIEEYLAKNLLWTCLSLNEAGTTKPYDVKSMKSLKVAVSSKSVVLPTDPKKKPKIGKSKLKTAVTKDKAKSGGATTVAELEHTKLKGGKEAHLRVGILPDIQNTTITGGKL